MKKAMISSMVSAGLALACLGDGGMREFKLPDGRSLKASIVGYNARIGEVEIEREDGVRVKVAPSVFVEADQRYIREWVGLSGFRNPATFRIDCKSRLVEKWRKDGDANVRYSDGTVEKESINTSKFQRHVYEISLQNNGSVALEGLAFEYAIFYGQDQHDARRRAVREEKTVVGELEVPRLDPGARVVLKTNPVVLEEKEYLTGDVIYRGGDPEKIRGELRGIWLKAAVKTPGGAAVVRDVFEPASIEGKYAWPQALRQQDRRRSPES